MKQLQVNDLLRGDVLLYRASNAWKNAMSVLIRKLDGTEVSHAGLYLGDEQVGESLIVGNPGLHSNPLQSSISGCDWVEVRRLASTGNLAPVMSAATMRLDNGSSYGFDQIMLVAAICVTHKLDLGDGLLRKIAYGALQRANEFVRSMSSEDREPMTCSEFVYRVYDEAVLEDDDEYSLTILSQSKSLPLRRFSGRRIRERLSGYRPEADIPVIHPDSLLAQFLEEPKEAGQPLYAAAAPIYVSEEMLDAMVYEWVGEQAPHVAYSSKGDGGVVGRDEVPDVSESQVEAMAQEFVMSVAEAPVVEEADKRVCMMASSSASPAQKALPVIADYVTPGDLLKSPSLRTVGRLHPS